MIRLRSPRRHPSDEELLLASDREGSPRRAVKVRNHIAQCDACHTRMSNLESTLAAFLSVHEQHLSLLPRPTGSSRASLKASLSRASASGGQGPWQRHSIWARQCAAVVVALLVVGGGLWLTRVLITGRRDHSTEIAGALPRRRLTPGATRRVRLDELCRNPEMEDDPPVDLSVEEQVLAEYGVPVAARTGYQLDYLITPKLGGSDDLHNLWPQPYSSMTWNAHVKDALEDRLHAMVCQGKMPLAMAQEEIATNWIAAYQREFHSETPLIDAATLLARTAGGRLRLSRELRAIETPVL